MGQIIGQNPRGTALVILATFTIATILKLLLLPSYHSTDYEVHRNWLAITNEMRPSRWYFETTSPWTLDYPPLFAWFERSMVSASQLADPLMSKLSSIDYMSHRSFAFMRSSVCTADLTLLLGTWLSSSSSHSQVPHVAAALVFLNAGLFMVDHIHFQFNGFLFGVLLLSIGALRRAATSSTHELKWGLVGGALFAALLVLKHLFLPLAPVYFVHLLLGFCWRKEGFSVIRLGILGVVVLAVLAAPFVPLVLDHQAVAAAGTSLATAAQEQLHQIGTRLFPFVAGTEGSAECNAHRPVSLNSCHDRGLVHAYWAANVWALYLFADRVLSFAAKAFPPLRFLLSPPAAAAAAGTVLDPLVSGDLLPSPSSGLVTRIVTRVVPNVSPSFAAAVTLAAIVPALVATAAGAHCHRLRRSTKKNKKSPRSRRRQEEEEEEEEGDSEPSAAVVSTIVVNPNDLFERSLVHASLSAFLFGWHVHEKAILGALVPLGILVNSPSDASLFLRLSGFGLFALFPLFTHPRETPTKVLLFLCFMRLAWLLLKPLVHRHRDEKKRRSLLSLGGAVDKAFIAALAAIFVFSEVLHPLFLKPQGLLDFLPLMLTSVVCAAGILLCWCDSAFRLVRDARRAIREKA